MKRAIIAFALALTTVSTAGESASRSPTIGLIPSSSPAITEALADGARLAIEQAAAIDGLEIELVVGSDSTHWSTAATPAIELAFGSEIVALVTPPDRQTAHLVTQIGSRAHIPVLATTSAPSIGFTGSYWVIPLVEPAHEAATVNSQQPAIDRSDPQTLALENAFRDRFGREFDGWAATGYKAASAVCTAVRASGSDRYRIVQALQSMAIRRNR